MAPPVFSITVDPPRCTMRIQMDGFWTEEAFERYQDERRHACQTMARQECGPDRLVILVDARNLGPQSQDVLPRIKDGFREVGLVARRAAVVVSSSLLAMQGARIIDSDRVRMFRTEGEAVSWLESE